jgi:hypothetical protein
VPHGILLVFNTILYENEFQNPQIFQQTISLFPEHSTLAKGSVARNNKNSAPGNPKSALLLCGNPCNGQLHSASIQYRI